MVDNAFLTLFIPPLPRKKHGHSFEKIVISFTLNVWFFIPYLVGSREGEKMVDNNDNNISVRKATFEASAQVS